MGKNVIPHNIGSGDNSVLEIRVLEMTDGLKARVDKETMVHRALDEKSISDKQMEAFKGEFWVLRKIGEVYNEIFA